MSKGWEFYWENCRYFVGAPDPATARTYLRRYHLRVAQHARCPTELAAYVVEGLQLQDGTVRTSKADNDKPWARKSARDAV